MSLPAPSPLNSNFTLIQNTKISASPNMKPSLKKKKQKQKAAMLDYLHQSKTMMKQTHVQLSPFIRVKSHSISPPRSDAAVCSCGFKWCSERRSRDAQIAGICCRERLLRSVVRLIPDWVEIPSDC